MEQVVQLIADYQWWIYGVLGLVLIFFLRRAMMARRENARSTFKLEQEQAQSRYNRSVVISAVILLVVIAAFVVSNPLLLAPPVDARTDADGHHRSARQSDVDAYAPAAHHHAYAPAIADAAQTSDESFAYA